MTGMQRLLDILEEASLGINMSVNLKKTVSMVFSLFDKRKIVCDSFPSSKLPGI